ncbi:MAG: acetylglutamate kinase, partial [Calditrichales bacterium]
MQSIKIVKIGGNVIDHAGALDQTLHRFVEISGPKLLVHGGGKLASDLSEKLGIVPVMVAGRRVTDAKSLEVVQMVYAGLINKNIVA